MTGVALQGLAGGIDDARRLAERLAVPFCAITQHRFPDGELLVTVGPAAPVTILYAPLDRPNDKLIALLLAAEALRRGGAQRLVLVAPYLCYMRQDTAFHPGEAISQRAIGRLLAGAFDRVVTVDAHLHRTGELASVFPAIRSDNLSATDAIVAVLRAGAIDPATLIVGPDEESRGWVGDLAGALGLAATVARKTRRGDRTVEIDFADITRVAGRPVLLVDDIVSSGGTLLACARALEQAGAASIDVVITHALFPPEMAESFAAAGVRSIRSTTSVPHPTNAIRLDQVLADALQSEIDAAPEPEQAP